MTKKRDKRLHSLQSFFAYAKRYKFSIGITILTFAIADVMITIIPVFIGKLVGALSAHHVRGHEAVIYVWVLIALSSGHNLLWRGGELLFAKLITPISFRYETILFQRVIHKPYYYFVDKFTGKLSSYITTISQEMRELLNNICYNYTNQVVSIVVVVGIMLSVNWQTGLIFVIGVISMFAVGRYSIRGSTRAERNFADVQSTKNAKIIDAIASNRSAPKQPRYEASSENKSKP
jgi:ATP-binding cassette subfamily B protein